MKNTQVLVKVGSIPNSIKRRTMQWSNSTHMLCTNYCSHYTTIQNGVSSPRWVVNRRLLAKDGKCATKKINWFYFNQLRKNYV